MFWARVNRTAPGGCWIYEGCINRLGYGQVKIEGRQWAPHRLVWTLFRGEIPAKLCVCHKCDIRPCCNPDHLFVGTQKDNITDMIAKGRKFLTVGDYKRTSVLTEEIVRSAREWHKAQSHHHREFGLSAYCRAVGVHRKTLKDAIDGVTWKHLT